MAKGEFYWSATKINAANYGACRYYIRYVLHKKSLRLSAYVKGSLLHSLVEHFWDRLGDPSEIKRDKKGKVVSDKKYSSPEEFVKYAQGQWTSIVIADKTADEKIAWKFEKERYTIRGQLRDICTPLFHHLVKIGPPLFSELPFDFGIDNERFKGRIDEIRVSPEGQISVLDYKSGRPWIGEMKLSHDPQLTLYNVAICAMLRHNPEFAARLGLEGKLDEFMAGGRFISPLLREGFFMIESLAIDPQKVKSMPEIIYETSRTDEHFFAFLKMVQSVKKRASEGDVYPESGKKCDDCDVKHECLKEMRCVNQGNYADSDGNTLFDFAAPAYARKTPIGEVSFAGIDLSVPEVPLTKSQQNRIQPKFHFRYPKKPASTENPAKQ